MADNQNKAVENVTISAIEKFKLNYRAGNVPLKSVATEEFKTYVVSKVSDLIKDGQIRLKATPSNAQKIANPSKLKAYVSSLVNNTWSKDMKFNGKAKQ